MGVVVVRGVRLGAGYFDPIFEAGGFPAPGVRGLGPADGGHPRVFGLFSRKAGAQDGSGRGSDLEHR